MEDITGTRGAVLLDENLEIMRKVPISQLYNFKMREVYVIVIDGIATLSIVKAVERLGCGHLAARNFAFTETSMDLVSL